MDIWLKPDSLSRPEALSLVSALMDNADWKIPAKAHRSVPDPDILKPVLTLPTLKEGVHRESIGHMELVGDLQKFLLGADFDIVVDENFGPKTAAVVREYQFSKGLEVDGRVGPQTWGALLADGFRPQSFIVDPGAYDRENDIRYSPRWPPKPDGGRSPNGLELFGEGFTYTPKPLPSNPEYVVPDSEWVKENIGTANIPQLVGVRGARSDGTMLFNKRLVPQVEALFDVWEKLGLSDRVLTFAGSWVPRVVRGRRDKLSNHSFGSAFDINAAWNGFRRQPALLGKKGCVRELVTSAYALGFYWGGWYNDGMHFEVYKALAEEELVAVVQELVA